MGTQRAMGMDETDTILSEMSEGPFSAGALSIRLHCLIVCDVTSLYIGNAVMIALYTEKPLNMA